MEQTSDDQVTQSWLEIKTLTEALDLDVAKSAQGNAAAGGRARKGLRLLKTKCSALVKLTLERDKLQKAQKSAAPEAV